MIITYDIECLKYDWIIVFKMGDSYKVIHNDKVELKAYIDQHKKDIFVGFNNYHYDDVVLAGLLLDKNPYTITREIITRKNRVKYRFNLITLDVIQELPMGVGLKSSQANLGMNIVESPIDFNLDRPLKKEELLQLIDYCKNDVKDTELLFNKRKDYFMAKFEIVNEFGLDVSNVKKTRAILSSKVLRCHKRPLQNDRLCIDYDPHINWDFIPIEVKNFFEEAEYDYNYGTSYEEIEKRKLEVIIAGVPHVIGFGGLHGAIEKYNADGHFLQIDVSSYYPSLIINNNFMSRASEEPKLYEDLRTKRFALKKEKNPKEYIYKILLNATYGAMKSEYNSLFDPKMANCICINGQIILIQLIKELEPYCQLIQSNTDGIIVKYNNNYDVIETIVKKFGNQFNLGFDIDKISKIAQRDVNNYAILFENGTVKAKGRFAKFDKAGYEQNTLTIIDKALVNYYIYGKSVSDTVLECYQSDNITPFQIIAKAGATYDGMFYEYGTEGNTRYISTQKVNRVFATNDRKYGGIYKRKGASYQKIANTSEHNIIHNDDISTFDKAKLDLKYYIGLCKKNLY